MAMITVKLFAGLRKTAGSREVMLEAGSLHAALDELVTRIPALQPAVWDGVALSPHVVLTLNGQVLDTQAELDLALQAGDTLAIFPPITGG
jgi:molybdopterin synthase sulfur carrier subunit